MPIFVGLMSGTSLDGIDAVVVEFPEDDRPAIRMLAAACTPICPELRARVLRLCSPGENEIDLMGELDVDLARLFAEAASNVVSLAGIRPADVSAIGSHGQTIRHRPGYRNPFTLQIGDPNTIAELTGITTVADFRRRDMAASGQGAPLVPAFHSWLFRNAASNRAVVNIGGMANITLLPTDMSRSVRGFDTGPGNVLLDAWHAQHHHGKAVDAEGRWARSGFVNESLLSAMMKESYLSLPPPKSTGRELFSINWLDSILMQQAPMRAEDVQATLTELTATSIANALLCWGKESSEIFLCGGGTHNIYLRERIAHHLPGKIIATTAELGVEPDWVEAVAFAWLAHQTLRGLPGNLPEVTGAKHLAVLGGIYPAGKRSS